ncbi:hypothetical protein BT96DRAFT_279793 [Gymnopus androsaceus JB14]|uniref:Dynamin N-terminal domain-containing protein n=1 Tax=Gymnopus androsaceus JB14 TaxID=1447944 RepID=A0A6A4I7X6_9AGAR|nr:hypothetical protein BT96DRAFT_279793 [Gymnopus androsaceus JB14]
MSNAVPVPQNVVFSVLDEVEKESVFVPRARTRPLSSQYAAIATSSGKSSLINTLLDDRIVPTSGWQACTSAVIEISHHVPCKNQISQS